MLAVLWAGLVLTFSQSSFAALLAGLAVLAALRWDVRRAAAAAAAALLLGGAFAVLFQDTLKIDLGSSGGLNKVTSGRADLIGGGVELFAKRPLQGYGSGSFGRAYRLERKGNQQQAVSASHTMPVTVAAEQGLIGLAAYLAVLGAALWALFGDAAWRAARGRAPPGSTARRRARRCAVPRRARRAGGDVRGARGAHDGLCGVPRGPVHVGDPGRRRVARAARAARPSGQAGSRPARATGPGHDLSASAMLVYLRRLASTGASYTASSVISKLFAVALLPVYTRHLTRADYGAAEVLLATVVALSIVFRLGIVEALLRFYYQDQDERACCNAGPLRTWRDEVVQDLGRPSCSSRSPSARCSSPPLPGRCRRRCSTGATRS